MSKPKMVSAPKYTLIEKTALELAATWYSIGRSQGMTSKWKDERSYARANFEKFIPKTVELLLSMLNRSDIHDLQKSEIYESLMERHNDPHLNSIMPGLPDIDIMKLLPKQERIADVNTTVLHNQVNPYKAKAN